MATVKRPPAASTKPIADIGAAKRTLGEISSLSRDGWQELQKATEAVVTARRVLRDAEEHEAFVSLKFQTLSKSIAEMQRQIDAKPYDRKLLAAFDRCKQAPWAKFARDGASDDQLLTVLKTGWPKVPDYNLYQVIEKGHGVVNGEAMFYATIEGVHQHPKPKPTLAGKALVAELRRLKQIPPAKAAAKPTPPKAGPKSTPKPPVKKPVVSAKANAPAAVAPAVSQPTQAAAKPDGEADVVLSVPMEARLGKLEILLKLEDGRWKNGWSSEIVGQRPQIVSPKDRVHSYATQDQAVCAILDQLLVDEMKIENMPAGERVNARAVINSIRAFRDQRAGSPPATARLQRCFNPHRSSWTFPASFAPKPRSRSRQRAAATSLCTTWHSRPGGSTTAGPIPWSRAPPRPSVPPPFDWFV